MQLELKSAIIISPLSTLIIKQWDNNKLIGREDEIRTRDPLLPKQVRYQAALLLDITRRNQTDSFDLFH